MEAREMEMEKGSLTAWFHSVFVLIDAATAEPVSFECSWVLVETGHPGRIDEEVECQVMGKVFPIRVQEVELVRVPMLEGGDARDECEYECEGNVFASSAKRKVVGQVPVVAVDSGSEEEKVSASFVSPRWQKNQLWEEDGGVLARAEVGESGSISMPDECVGMVSRVAKVEQDMADRRVALTVDGESDLAGGVNPFEVIEFDPNSSGGLVVEQSNKIHLVSNSNSKL
ncbi:hypothetical protein V6N12_067852 [Hibiscus sabdariffa]|uniref:Uncharacterized protein n=1 Tax=Hibiscus sabdariffa TaxID=183260 RepID=A0ABR2FNJ3_9ROSI